MAGTIEGMVFRCIRQICNNLIAKKDLLNDLDAVMGDGEHGSNIQRSFGMVQDALPQLEGLPAGDMIDKTGSLLLAAGGGTATTLMGFACKKTAVQLRNISGNAPLDYAQVMKKTWESIQKKSQASVGDKTLMDAYTPAVQAFEQAAQEQKSMTECFLAAGEAAEKGAAETSNMIAKRGRGYYVGERGLGTCDPGAVSVATIFTTIGESLKEFK